MAEVSTKSLLSASKPPVNKAKASTRSLRFDLTLKETTKAEYSEFNYLDLVEEEKEKHVRQKVKTNGHHDPDDPLGDGDSQQLREIARRFEQKYGTGGSRKKRREINELGAGYDENDPFIDNSDVYDEELPSNKQPALRGFYINTGLLQLQLIEGAEPDRPPPAKRKRVQRLSSDDENLTSADDQPSPTPEEKPPRKRLGRPPKKDTMLQKKKRQAIDGLLKKRPAMTVKEMLKQKKALQRQQRTGNGGPSPLPPAQTAAQTQPKPEHASAEGGCLTNGNASGHASPRDSIDESIASVVAAAAREATSPLKPPAPAADTPAQPRQPSSSSAANSSGEDSSDSSSSDSSSEDGSSSAGDDAADEEEDPAPEERCRRPSEDGLPAMSPDLATLVAAIKEAALVSNRTGEGKQKFFSPDVNKMLLNIELRSQQELLRKDRQALYLHLASRLPCGAQTLNKRAKQLLLDEEKHVIRKPIARLKEAIDAAMPAIQEQYTEECKKVMEAKELPMPDAKKTEGGAGEPEKKPTLPRKRFRWDPATREKLRRVVEVRAYSFKMLKKRQGSADEFLSSFLDTDVLPLWPRGWMTARELMKHCLPVFQEEIKKKARNIGKPQTPPRPRGRPPNDPNKHLTSSHSTKHHTSSPRPSLSASPRARVPSPDRTSRPPQPSPVPHSHPTQVASAVTAAPSSAAAVTAAPEKKAQPSAEPSAEKATKADCSPPKGEQVMAKKTEKVAEKSEKFTEELEKFTERSEKVPEKSAKVIEKSVKAVEKSDIVTEKLEEKSKSVSEKSEVTVGEPPPPTDQLWRSFSPDMTVEAMAKRLKRQMNDIRAHVAFKLRENGGQQCPETLRYQDELRRLEVALREVSKGQAKLDKKKKLAKQADPVSEKPASSGAPKCLRPDEKKPKPPRPSLTAQLKPARPDTPVAPTGSPAGQEVARQTPAAGAETARVASSTSAVIPTSTPNGLMAEPGSSLRDGKREKSGSDAERRTKGHDPSKSTPVLPPVVPPVTATFQEELEKLRQGMNSSAQRMQEQRGSDSSSQPRDVCADSATPSVSQTLPSPEKMRAPKSTTVSPPLSATPVSPERKADRQTTQTTSPQSENKHASPKKIHLYGRTMNQPSLDGAGDTVPELESLENQSKVAEEVRKKEELHKRIREINEAEVNDAVASIMGGCADTSVADLSLYSSPEPPPRRSSAESHPALCLRRASSEGGSLCTSAESEGRRTGTDAGSALARPAIGGTETLAAVPGDAGLTAPRKDSMDDFLSGLSSSRETTSGRALLPESRPDVLRATDGLVESHVSSVTVGWPDDRRISTDSTADFFRPDLDDQRRVSSSGDNAASSRRRRSRAESGTRGATQRSGCDVQGLDLSSSAGKRPSQEEVLSRASSQQQSGVSEAELGELDWVMQELMSFNNQRKDAPTSAESRPAPPSPASAPAVNAPTPARSSILQMAAHQADIFSPDPPQRTQSSYSSLSSSRSPFSPDQQQQQQPIPAARPTSGGLAPSRSFEGSARAVGVERASSSGGVALSRPETLQHGATGAFGPGGESFPNYRGAHQPPGLPRSLSGSGGVSPAPRADLSEGLMGHFPVAASAPRQDPMRQETSPQPLPASPQSPMARQSPRYTSDARLSPVGMRPTAFAHQIRQDSHQQGHRQESHGGMRQDYRSSPSPARPDAYPLQGSARQDPHQIPSPARQDPHVMARQDSHSMPSPSNNTMTSPVRPDRRQVPSPGRQDPYVMHSPLRAEAHPLHNSGRPDSLALPAASRQERMQSISPVTARHDRMFNSTASSLDSQMAVRSSVPRARDSFAVSSPGSQLDPQLGISSQQGSISSLPGRQESSAASPSFRAGTVANSATLRHDYSPLSGMTSSAQKSAPGQDALLGGMTSRPERGNFSQQLQMERDLLGAADMAVPRQIAAQRRHGVTSSGDRSATTPQRPPSYYTSEDLSRRGGDPASDTSSRALSGMSSQAAGHLLASGGGRDYGAIYNAPYHQAAPQSTRQQPEFRPPAPVAELSAYQMRPVASGSFLPQFQNPLVDFSQDEAQRRQQQRQQQQQRPPFPF